MNRHLLTAFALASALAPSAAFASFHEWLPDEAFSNPSGTIQFLEFSDQFDFENFLSISGIQTNANTYNFPGNLPSSSTANQHFLVGTAAFAALPGAPTPDFIIPNNFFSTTTDSISIVGGVQPALTFSAGQLPTDGTTSLLWDGATRSTATNSPTNFAGVTGTVTAIPEPASLGLIALGISALLLRRRR